MLRSPFRFVVSGMLAVSLAACSGSNGSVVPPSHRGTSGKLTAATFTIKWTNPTATASMRRKDTISPAAQSITVSINGKSVATANRGSSPTQQIALDAPVGIDQFLFNVYDQPAGQGHLLGSAQVNQQIIDGATNSVSAAIQALCSVTNVSVSDAIPVSVSTYGASGIMASTLQSVILLGQFKTTLAVEPEDVDGDVIIAGTGTGGTVPNSFTGSATVTVVDGSHLALTASGPSAPTSSAATLTVAAAGCPSTTVPVKQSPAIFAQAGTFAAVFDWYGDLAYYGNLQAGEKLIGYDSAHVRMITYTPSTGQVAAYDPTLATRTPLYTILTNSVVAWSNFLGQVFAAHWNGSNTTTFFTYTGSAYQNVSSTINSQVVSIATAVDDYQPLAYATNGSYIYSFGLSPLALTNSVPTPHTVNALATCDFTQNVYAFNTASPFVTRYDLYLGSPTNSDDAFGAPAIFGATDSDNGDIYGMTAGELVEGSTSSGVALPGFGFSLGSTPSNALVVVSANE